MFFTPAEEGAARAAVRRLYPPATSPESPVHKSGLRRRRTHEERPRSRPRVEVPDDRISTAATAAAALRWIPGSLADANGEPRFTTR